MSQGLGITLDVRDGVTPAVQVFLNGLRSKAGIHEAIGRRALALTRNHLIELAETRHDTATSLDAAPTGHWAQAVDKTSLARASSAAATISINQPGIARAAHDVTIVPGEGKQFLTIANRAEGYGQRAYRQSDLLKLVYGKKGPWALVPKEFKIPRLAGGKTDAAAVLAVAWYVLVTSVHQKQDRTLLPSDEEYQQAILEGCLDYVDYLISLSGGRDSKRGFIQFGEGGAS